MSNDGIYEGPLVVACDGPRCNRATPMESGTPAPEAWLYLDAWRDGGAHGIGYFCSVACLEDAMPNIVSDYGERFPRR